MKKEIVETLRKVFPSVSKRKLGRIYNLILSELSQSVREGKRTRVMYFGTFKRKTKDGVKYYNPKAKKWASGVRIWIAFKPTKHLKGKV